MIQAEPVKSDLKEAKETVTAVAILRSELEETRLELSESRAETDRLRASLASLRDEHAQAIKAFAENGAEARVIADKYHQAHLFDMLESIRGMCFATTDWFKTRDRLERDFKFRQTWQALTDDERKALRAEAVKLGETEDKREQNVTIAHSYTAIQEMIDAIESGAVLDEENRKALVKSVQDRGRKCYPVFGQHLRKR